MNRVPAVTGLLFIFVLLFSHATAASAPERSVSSSRQFVVYGSEPDLRGALCELAERNKRDALRILGTRDEWQTPIVIHAAAAGFALPGAPAAHLQVNQTGAGLKFQLELRIAADVRVPEVERQLLRAILLEMMYRSQPDLAPGTPYVEPPDWLVDGILALAPERADDSVAQLLKTAIAGDVLSFTKFLQQKRALLDSPSQALYRAYSAALVTLLLDRPGGAAQLLRFVDELDRASSDPMADLLAHFPTLGVDLDALEKNWRRSVARLAGSERFRLLTCLETDRQLTEILRVSVPEGERTTVYTLEEAAQFRRNPAAAPDLRRLTSELMLLSGRAHPLYTPVIYEYQRMIAQLLRRKAPKPRRLAELRALREGLSRRMDAIADYLNWYEATQARVASGAFRDYLRAADEMTAPIPRRRDPISVYLDALETQF